jgi:hypothetical protein
LAQSTTQHEHHGDWHHRWARADADADERHERGHRRPDHQQHNRQAQFVSAPKWSDRSADLNGAMANSAAAWMVHVAAAGIGGQADAEPQYIGDQFQPGVMREHVCDAPDECHGDVSGERQDEAQSHIEEPRDRGRHRHSERRGEKVAP